MKNVILTIVVIFIIAIGYVMWSNMSTDTMPANTPETRVISDDIVTKENTTKTIDDSTKTDTINSKKVNAATDAGMEFPTPTTKEPAVTEPPAVVTETPTPAKTVSESHTFNIGGTNFSFDVKEIHVKKGDTVTINFTSNSGFHDWTIDAFKATTGRVQTGGTANVTFVASKTGTFEYYCSVGSHRAQGMVGNLIVE